MPGNVAQDGDAAQDQTVLQLDDVQVAQVSVGARRIVARSGGRRARQRPVAVVDQVDHCVT